MFTNVLKTLSCEVTAKKKERRLIVQARKESYYVTANSMLNLWTYIKLIPLDVISENNRYKGKKCSRRYASCERASDDG